MIYFYICPKCNSKKEIEKGMNDAFPVVRCDDCKKIMKRDYSGEAKDRAIIIPDDFKMANQKDQRKMDYSKSWGKEKHFY
jgi:hypothetical protein